MGAARATAATASAALVLVGLVACSGGSTGSAPTGGSTSLVPGATSSTSSGSPSETLTSPSPSVSSSPPASTPASTPSTTSATATPPAEAPVTTVRLQVIGTGCRDCAFEAFITVRGVAKSLGLKSRRTDSPISWRVPTAATRSLVLRFTDVADAETGGNPTVVVMQYAGTRAGSVLTVRQAQAKGAARMCWAGTTRRAATITVRVELPQAAVTPSPPPGQDPTYAARLVYTAPMAGGSGRYRDTIAGGLGVPGSLVCP